MTIIGVMLSSLSWLVWPLYLYVCYGIISIAAILVRIGVERKNSIATWIDANMPETIRLIGMRMSGEAARRVFYSFVFVTLGWFGHDSWEFRHTFVITDLTTIAQPGDILQVNGKTESVPQDTWWFQRNKEPKGQAFPATFCENLVPGLKRGYQIDVVVYSIPPFKNNCWNIASNPLGIIYR